MIKRRKALGFNQKTLATEVNAQVKTVARWEQGKSYPRAVYLEPLARALRVDLPELDRLLNPGSAPVLEGHPVPGWLGHYEALVAEAGQLAQVELVILPALLQTASYADAIERLGPLPLSDQEVAERVRRRISRQALLSRRPNPLKLVATISELALHRNVGGRQLMYSQLGRLADVARLPNVEVRIIPADGRDACAISGFELLTRPDEVKPFVALGFDLRGSRYFEDACSLKRFTTMLDHLSEVALDPEASLQLIEAIRDRHRNP
jgi:transcriptional regulator with XRE-family HTH domain